MTEDREALADLARRAMTDAWTDESEHTAAPYAVADAIIAAGFRRHPEPDTIPLSLHNALIEQERRNAAIRREERDREWRAALADQVKPSREDVARILNPVAWKAYDAMMATYPDEPTNPVIVEDSLTKADAMLALWDRR